MAAKAAKMALDGARKQSRRFNNSAPLSSPKLNLSDVTCPICLSLLLEPVTLPCGHELCRVCFQKTLLHTSLSCPICRLRLSSWARKATRERRLVNERRWRQIQAAFPDHVEARLFGNEDDDDKASDQPQLSKCKPHLECRSVSAPGEIRKEFEQQMEQWLNGQEKERQEAEKKSFTTLLKTLCKEHKLDTSFQLSAGAKVRNLSVSANSSSIGTAKVNQNDSGIIEDVDKESARGGQSRSWSPESNDSITQELCHFKPIKIAPKTPPKKLPDGRVVEPVLVVTTPRNLTKLSEPETENVYLCKAMRQKLSKIGTERMATMNLSCIENIPNKCSKSTQSCVKSKRCLVPTAFSNAPCAKASQRDQSRTKDKDVLNAPQEESKSKRGRGRPKKINTPKASSTGHSSSETKPLVCPKRMEPEPVPGTSHQPSPPSEGVKMREFEKPSCSNAQAVNTPTMLETEAILAQQMLIMQQLKQEELDRQLAYKLQQKFNSENQELVSHGMREPYKLRKRPFNTPMPTNKCRRMMS